MSPLHPESQFSQVEKIKGLHALISVGHLKDGTSCEFNAFEVKAAKTYQETISPL